MSTRGFIAFANDNDTYEEVPTHYDGYPDHMLTNLIILLNRDGLNKVRETITRYGLWTSINNEQPDTTGVTPDQEADFGTPARCAWEAQNYGRTYTPGYGEHVEFDDFEGNNVVDGAENVLDTALFEDTIWNEFGYIVRPNGNVETYANVFGSGWKHVGTTNPSNHAGKSAEELREIITDDNVPA